MLLTAAGLPLLLGHCERDEAGARVDQRALKELAKLGQGFVVWETFRHGAWQIWSKSIDGTRNKRIIPGERGRDHFCPKISPDGRYVAYMSYERGSTAYDRATTGSLWVMDLAKKKRRKVAQEARSYAEDRAVAWFDEKRFCFIDAEGYTVEADLESRTSRRITNHGDPDFGWLVNATKTHATTGTPEFAPYDAKTQTIQFQNRHAGCQPYFTRDGEWGYWMGGAGGPLNRMRLSTRLVDRLIKKDDPRLSPEWNYFYFPLVSPCQRLLVYAASRGDHDHFEADYEIFIARIHPETLDLMGPSLRFTDSPHCDRYPDVFRRELPLGSHFVEGETQVKFIPPEKAEWDWDLGNGDTHRGRTASGWYRKPGEYWVEAKSDRRTVRGYVHVSKPEPPKVMAVRRQGAAGVVLHFNEKIDASAASARLRSGERCEKWEVINGGVSLSVTLPKEAPRQAMLLVEGVRDVARKPNVLAASEFRIPGQAWPAATDGLVFAWSDSKAENKMADGFVCRVEPHGRAFWNEHQAMECGGGWFDAPEAGRRVAERCRETNSISVEMILRPADNPDTDDLLRILTMATTPNERNITLGQKRGMLCLWLATEDNGPAGNAREIDICKLNAHEFHHVVLSYRPGEKGGDGSLGVMVDGEDLYVRPRLRGGFANWIPRSLRFGAAPDGSSAWRGAIEAVAIFDRALTDAEALEHFASAERLLGGRGAKDEWQVKARVAETSRVPLLQEIQPYKNALVKHRYDVLEKLQGGDLPHREMVITHWCWLGGEAMPAQKYQAGDEVTLRIQKLDSHPEIKGLVARDDLTAGFDAEQFFDAGWVDAR